MTFQTPISLVDSQSNHPHHSMSYYMNQHYCCKYIVFFRNIFFNSIRFINNTLLINLLPLHHPMNIIQSIFQELIKLPYKLQNQELFLRGTEHFYVTGDYYHNEFIFYSGWIRQCQRIIIMIEISIFSPKFINGIMSIIILITSNQWEYNHYYYASTFPFTDLI